MNSDVENLVIRLFVTMRFCVFFLVCVSVWTACLGLPAHSTSEEPVQCPPDEYHPGGPGCGLEPSCPPRGFHTATWHASTECRCWCKPGLYRDSDTKQCIPDCN